MKILIYTPAFLPKIGGLENMAHMLGKELSALNHQVTIITLTANDNHDNFLDYSVIRKPSLLKLWQEYLHCDLILYLNISLKGIWPLLFKKKPAFVSHQITYFNFDGSLNYLERLKRYLTRYMINISCSDYVRQTLPKSQGVVIHNAYDQNIFKSIITYTNRTKDLVMVGRLVSDKGVDTLLEALYHLKKDNILPNLSIIGEGPELSYLKGLSTKYNLDEQVIFLGKIIGTDLAQEINKHKIMIVPSKWKEPFGLVALEGLACGCKLIVSDTGGLKEASGGFCSTFENGNAISLYEILKISIKDNLNSPDCSLHLKNHEAVNITKQYAQCFNHHSSLSN